MTTARSRELLRQVCKLAAPVDGVSDQDLLHRFAVNRDEAAFAEIVRRHGAMAYRTAERILHNAHDAEDVFQATFLTLSRKAGTLTWRESVGPWIYEVANRLALEARTAAARRRRREGKASPSALPDPLTEISLREAQAIFDEELLRLGEKFRAPLVLCHLEGATQDEAARQLGLPLGTFRRRLEQARDRLRKRLARRGLALSGVLLAGVAAPASAAVPAALVQLTVRAAMLLAAGGDAAGVVGSSVLALVQSLGGGVTFARGKLVAAIFLTVALTASVGFAALQPAESKEPPPPPTLAPDQPGPQQPAEKRPAGVDHLGDPLPAGAIARMGTLRFRFFDNVSTMTYSPDGKLLAASGSEGLRVWEIATGKPVIAWGGVGDRLPRPQFAGFSPDSALVIASGLSQEPGVRVFSVATGKEVQLFEGFPADATALAFSPDGKRVATGGNGKVQLWDRLTGKLLREVSEPDSKLRVPLVRFTEDGKVLAAHVGNDLVLRDAETSMETKRFLIGARPLSISPDGKTAATCSWPNRPGAILVYDLAAGKALGPLPFHACGRQPFFTADSKYLLAPVVVDDGDVPAELVTWDIAARKVVGKRKLDEPSYVIRPGVALAVSPDGKNLATVYGRWDARRVRFWDFASGKERVPFENPHDSWSPAALAFSPDGQTFATVDGSRATVRLWKTHTGEPLRQMTDPTVKDCTAVAFTPDGKAVFAGTTLWDMDTGKLIRRFDGWGGRLSPDGKTVAIASGRGKLDITLCKTATGEMIARIPCPARLLQVFSFSQDSKTLTAAIGPHGGDKFGQADPDRTVGRYVWDAATGKSLDEKVIQWGDHVEAVAHAVAHALAQNGRLVVAREQNFGKMFLHDTQHNENKYTVFGCAVVFSPDERMYAITCHGNPNTDNSVRVYETATGQERFRLPGLKSAEVTKCRPDTRHEQSRLAGLKTLTHSLAFSADGRMLATGNHDTTALIWDLTGRMQNGRLVESKLTDQQLQEAWDALRGDARQAHTALWTLAAAPAQSLPWLKRQLTPAAATEEQIDRWVAELGHEKFAVRVAADVELEKCGKLAEKALRRGLTGKVSLEARRRIEMLLDRLGQLPLLAGRSVEVLERVGTTPACEILETLAAGAPHNLVREEARQSLRRLRQKEKAR